MSELKLIHTTADPVRLSFPDLYQATQYEGKGPFRYNATFLVVPGGANDTRIKAAILEAVSETWPKANPQEKIAGYHNNSNRNCYVPGDSKKYEGYAGKWALTAHRKQEAGKPGIFDCTRAGPDGKPLALTVESGKPYAGCYVNAVLDIYCQDGQNHGIRCGLRGVFFAADGDAFSGSKVADAGDFDVSEGSAAADLV